MKPLAIRVRVKYLLTVREGVRERERERETDSQRGREGGELVHPRDSHSGAQKLLVSFIRYGRLCKALYLSSFFL